MNDILQAIMDADTALQRVQEGLERFESVKPGTQQVGQTQYFNCPCGTPVHYGDRYCRMCGRRIRWDG